MGRVIPRGLVGRLLAATEAAPSGRRGAEVAALGLSGQMHGVVLADEGGRPCGQPSSGPTASIRRRARCLPGLWKKTCAGGSPTRPPSAWPARASSGCATTSPTRTPQRAGRSSRRTGCRMRLTGRGRSRTFRCLRDPALRPPRRRLVPRGGRGTLGLRAGLLAPLVPSAGVAGTLTREAASELGLRMGTAGRGRGGRHGSRHARRGAVAARAGSAHHRHGRPDRDAERAPRPGPAPSHPPVPRRLAGLCGTRWRRSRTQAWLWSGSAR